MRTPVSVTEGLPSWRELQDDARRAPVTTVVCLLSIVLSVARWMDRLPGVLEIDPRVGEGEVWRFLTANLVHVNLIHLLFNLYWVRAFGVAMEPVVGRSRYLLLLLATALLSDVEYVFLDGGIGLSGVCYGLFGWLVIRREEDRWARDVLPRDTLVLFAVWFFLCILLTVTKILPVGNAAHAGGFVAGWLFGLAGSRRRYPHLRRPAAALLLVAAAAVLPAATVWRPLLNRSAGGWVPETMLGYAAYGAGDYAAAERRWGRAVHYRNCRPGEWYNLALARYGLGDREGAEQALRECLRRMPESTDARELQKLLSEGR